MQINSEILTHSLSHSGGCILLLDPEILEASGQDPRSRLLTTDWPLCRESTLLRHPALPAILLRCYASPYSLEHSCFSFDRCLAG